MAKFKPKKLNKVTPTLIPSKVEQNKKVSFNFRFLIDCEKFRFSNVEKSYFLTLMQRFSDLSSSNRLELVTNRSPGLRCHTIDWNDVTEDSFGIKNEEICNDAYQIALTSNKHGRVHGFFIEDVFYVRWLDPEHNLYS